ncbi:MAG: site-specific DNA-methyltransferase, partial [Oscillospiraceae bacterium]|nr:site-specific DNA-methyltransferase [Oscillospiraceae bacterium]
IEDLKPYERNARRHEAADVAAIVKSIEAFGFNDPVGVWGPQNVIVEGHGRVMAAKQLGMTEVPCIRLDDLTDEQRRAYALAHNKTAELSTWDAELLPLELEDLPTIDMAGFGFDLDKVAGDFLRAREAAKVEEDDFDPGAEVEKRAKPGDIWQLGDHRLMCGDSTDPDAWKCLMDGELADMVFTDPPYGVAIGDKNKALNAVQPSGRRTENIKGDTMTEEQLYEMLKKAFENVRDNCAEDACYFVTSPQGGSLGLMMMMMMMKDAGLPVRHVLMWRKNTATFSLGRLDYDYQHEPIFYTWTKKHHNYREGDQRTTVWEYDKPRKCDLHPTMKPVALVANAVLDGSRGGMLVLDAFGGSGTTLIACEQLGRRCRMMELDPHYVDVIIDRWEKMTGKEAYLIDG